MTDSLTSGGAPATMADGTSKVWPLGAVLRDIARGGVTGITVGLLVGGLGGRLVMRAATLLHADTVGLTTENGAVIGEITTEGTMALTLFGGLGAGLVAGVLWVIVSPWVPHRMAGRALVMAVAAMALGTPLLVRRTNHDFLILGFDPLVVALLVGLVAVAGVAIPLVDDALEARLPAATEATRVWTLVYLGIAALGLLVVLPMVVALLIVQNDYLAPIRAGWALAVAGACTLAWWLLRVNGRSAPPDALRRLGTISVGSAVVLGLLTSLPHVLGALGVPIWRMPW